VSSPIDLLIRDLRSELTDQRTAGRSVRQRTDCPLRRAAPLQLEELFGSKSIFDFAELVKDTIPIDPDRDWPPGQMLGGVKLQRARGGCLGAKSR
jgi:hypothetical protein